MDYIALDTREKQAAFMNPVRQDLLRLLLLNGRAMTAKELSDRLGVSASSATFHIKKLLDIGVIELERTEKIHGITARYYRATNTPISLGYSQDSMGDKELFFRRTADQISDGLRLAWKLAGERALPLAEAAKLGDRMDGILYLTQEEAGELHRLIWDYLDAHSTRRPGTQAYEFLMMAYNASEVRDDVE